MKCVLDPADAVRRLMEELSIVGLYDVRWEGSRATGYVGKPGDHDMYVVVSITTLTEDDPK